MCGLKHVSPYLKKTHKIARERADRAASIVHLLMVLKSYSNEYGQINNICLWRCIYEFQFGFSMFSGGNVFKGIRISIRYHTSFQL